VADSTFTPVSKDTTATAAELLERAREDREQQQALERARGASQGG
jgi:hypothetical protein